MCVQVEEELWEEEFIERCIQELLEEEEQWEWFIPSRDLPSQTVGQIQDQISLLVLESDVHADADFDIVVSSRLQQPIRHCCYLATASVLFLCSSHCDASFG